jgi:hypothetical protein
MKKIRFVVVVVVVFVAVHQWQILWKTESMRCLCCSGRLRIIATTGFGTVRRRTK